MSITSVYVPRVSHVQPLLPQETLQRLEGRCGPSSYEITAFVLVPGACEFFCMPFKSKVSFPLSCGALAVKACQPSKSTALRAPLPYARSPGWGAWHGVLNSQFCGRTSVIQFSPVFGLLTEGYGVWLYCKTTPHTCFTVFLSLCL